MFIWRHGVNAPKTSTTFSRILICVIVRPGICNNTLLCSVLHWRIIMIKRFFSRVHKYMCTRDWCTHKLYINVLISPSTWLSSFVAEMWTLLKTEEIGSYTRLYWRSGISSTRVRNSTSFHSFRYAPLVKRRNFSHSWKKLQIFNRDSCKNLLIFHVSQEQALTSYIAYRFK